MKTANGSTHSSPSHLHASAPAVVPLRMLTINTHKGRSAWNRRFMLGELRDAVRSTGADIVFLQEVIGERNERSGGVHGPHYEFLADQLWPQFAYGRNAVYPHGHHGNALLSKYPISSYRNRDASVRRHEPRGLLHCVLQIPAWGEVHAVCVHLGLRESHRQAQLRELSALINEWVPPHAPLLVAGDFNDWRGRAPATLMRLSQLRSAFRELGVREPRTFPARRPLLALDRIYVRGVGVLSACALSTGAWPHLSDHLPLMAELQP